MIIADAVNIDLADTFEQVDLELVLAVGAQLALALENLRESRAQRKMLLGAPAGKYKARIILGDESDEGVPKRKGDPFHKRFLDFEKSKLSFTVPSGDYTVTVSKK